MYALARERPKASPGGKLAKIYDFWLMREAGQESDVFVHPSGLLRFLTARHPSSDLAPLGHLLLKEKAFGSLLSERPPQAD